jgi:hypothetical protein
MKRPDNAFDPVYSRDERALMLKQMRLASDVFYLHATRIGCHPFIEFTGLLNEYIKICEVAQDKDIDFTQSNAHTGRALPIEKHHVAYLGEKLGCIYGPGLDEHLALLLLETILKR